VIDRLSHLIKVVSFIDNFNYWKKMAPASKKLVYTVHKWSSYSGNYFPEYVILLSVSKV